MAIMKKLNSWKWGKVVQSGILWRGMAIVSAQWGFGSFEYSDWVKIVK
jgi:hypothetical protein